LPFAGILFYDGRQGMFPVYFVNRLFPWEIRFQGVQNSQAVDFFSGSLDD